jgi:hypothetical protein
MEKNTRARVGGAERAAEIGDFNPKRMVITSHTCVIVNKLGRPFRAGLLCESPPRAKAPGLFCFPPSGECRPPAYLNAYGQLPDIESRLKRPRQLKPTRMALKN